MAVVFACAWALLGQSLQAAAQNSAWMICARVLAGIGTGGISAIIPVWSSELVPHTARGMVIAFEMCVNFAGISASCKFSVIQDAICFGLITVLRLARVSTCFPERWPDAGAVEV